MKGKKVQFDTGVFPKTAKAGVPQKSKREALAKRWRKKTFFRRRRVPGNFKGGGGAALKKKEDDLEKRDDIAVIPAPKWAGKSIQRGEGKRGQRRKTRRG